VVVCDGCGHKLRTMGTTNQKTGDREAIYVCASRYASGHCPAPAAAKVKLVDGFVVERFQDEELVLSSARADAERRYPLTKEKVRDAEAALDQWVDDSPSPVPLAASGSSAGSSPGRTPWTTPSGRCGTPRRMD
jgi:hypothetical protein